MTEDDTRQRELAVIEAAKVWHNCNDHESWQKAGEALIDAVDALTAPQPVDPQTLKRGDKFKFPGDKTVYVWRFGENRMWAVPKEPWLDVKQLVPGDSVIPLPEDTE